MNIPSPQEAQIRFRNVYKDSVARAAIRVPFDNLDNGTRVLSDESECIRYTALYGGHHFYKLNAAYSSTQFEIIAGRDIEIFDWGCGQALATYTLIDYFIENNINLNVLSITLIEPSTVALQSGCSLVQRMFQNDSLTNPVIRLVNKYMNDVTSTDLVSQPNNIKIRLFSNIIDVESFDLRQLYLLMINTFQGINRVICTSPDNRQKQRLETFYDFFSQSHQVTKTFSSCEAIYGEIFYAASGRYEERRIGRCEKQFTVNLTKC
jgi:hypothetical protein